MSTRVYNFLISLASGLVAIFIMGGTYQYFQAHQQRPVVYTKTEIINTGPIHAGDTITVRLHRTKYRVCPATFDYYILPASFRSTPGRVVKMGSVPTIYSPLGEGYVDVLADLPADIKPGEYEFTEIAHIWCSPDAHHTATPPGRFTVE